MLLFQQFFDCGRPPQAGRSGRRQQQHQPGFIAPAIEVMLKLFEVILRQRCERGLTAWRSFRQPEVPDDQDRSNDPDQPNAYLTLRVCMSYPAIKLAITCGKRITRRTIKAAPQNRTMLNGLRFWH